MINNTDISFPLYIPQETHFSEKFLQSNNQFQSSIQIPSLNFTLLKMVIESAQHAAPNWVPVRDKPVFSHDRKLKVICVGAGFAGLLITHKWKYEGMHEFFDLDIFEKYPDVGGTWFENRYPGAGCDVSFT